MRSVVWGAMQAIDCAAEVWEALERTADGHCFTVPRDWEGIPGRAFGGFAAAGLVAAAGTRTSLPRPLGVHARFHRPVPIEVPLDLRVDVEREGRSVSAYRVELIAPDARLLCSASVSFGQGVGIEMQSQPGEPMPELVDPMPVAEVLAARGIPAPRVMERVAFRGSSAGVVETGFHLNGDWPATRSPRPLDRAIDAVMCVDNFIAAATMRANGVDLEGPWPAMAPNLDVTAWFHPAAGPDPEAHTVDRLRVRTEVARTAGGFAVGRTQVWAGHELTAEGMSQVILLPAPA